jgi:hypothetical protein
MPSASDSAYPRLKTNPSAKELGEIYAPNIFELVFALAHKATRSDWLPIVREEARKDGSSEEITRLDLSFVTDKWWPLVAGKKDRDNSIIRAERRHFELCVFSQIMLALKSGDLAISGSGRFDDYRGQLVSEAEYENGIALYGEQAGISIERLRRNPDPEGLQTLERLLKERMTPVDIVDALSDTDHWLNWTRHFGPISGHDAKLENPRERYLITAFCYGCNLGPTQTARSIKSLDRRQLAFVNQRHVTEKNLNDAITTVINAYAQFPLQRLWGLGKSASADGMK